MKTTIDQHAQDTFSRWARVGLLALVMAAVAGCGEVDSSDGQVRNSVALPTDSVLTLFCEDAGIANEPCILNDPDNPYASTSIDDSNKFQLSDAAPSAKARFYLWATAQAMSPRGENQYYTALSLHQMHDESGSQLAKAQALRAYRSVLDNYFNEVTFFGPFTINGEEVVTPQPVRIEVGQNLYDPEFNERSFFGSDLQPIFSANAQNNRTLAKDTFGQWGYTYDVIIVEDSNLSTDFDAVGDFTRNF